MLEGFFRAGKAKGVAALSQGRTEERLKADRAAHLLDWQELYNRCLASPLNSGSGSL